MFPSAVYKRHYKTLKNSARYDIDMAHEWSRKTYENPTHMNDPLSAKKAQYR